MKLKEIVFTTKNGDKIKLSAKEAKALRNELNELFGEWPEHGLIYPTTPEPVLPQELGTSTGYVGKLTTSGGIPAIDWENLYPRLCPID